jgi:hypothetical protein
MRQTVTVPLDAGDPRDASGSRGHPRLSQRAVADDAPPNVTWMLTCDAWPNARWRRGPDFTAFDGELLVGRVFQLQDGADKGLWFWTMSVEQPGTSFPGPTSGLEREHGEAGLRVVEAYRALLTNLCGVRDCDKALSPEMAPSDAQPEQELSRQQRRYQDRQRKKEQGQIERQAKKAARKQRSVPRNLHQGVAAT